jgi:acetyl-CoA carboxylase carboxyltransferase component
MEMKKKIARLESVKEKLSSGGGPEAIKKQRAAGKLTAWERIELLFDQGTFQELDLMARAFRTGFEIDNKETPRDAIIVGYGEINKRTVYAASYDYTVAGGSQASTQMMKLAKMIEHARNEGYPYVGIIDSGGRRLQDRVGKFGYRTPICIDGCGGGQLDMFSPPMASGIIPQICVMLGPCYAGAAYFPMMSDFLIFRRGVSFMSVASPALLKAVTFKDVTQEEIGGALLHATTTGSCDILAESDEEALQKCRELLGFLPSNWKEKPPVVDTGDDPARRDEKLVDLVPTDDSQPLDMHRLIASIADNGEFFEIGKLWAPNLMTGYARLAGRTVGIVANNPMVAHGALNADTCDKEAHFIRTCDCFNVPLIFLVDTPGFLPSLEQEQSREGLERHAAKPVFAICEATVPRIVLYVGKCYGAARLVMGSRGMGVDSVLAWPSGELRPMDLKSLAMQIYHKEIAGMTMPDEVLDRKVDLLAKQFEEPYNSAGLMAIEDIISPPTTRIVLINRLNRLLTKQETRRPWKKQSLIRL